MEFMTEVSITCKLHYFIFSIWNYKFIYKKFVLILKLYLTKGGI